MVLNYDQCINLFKTDYKIKKMINKNLLFKIDKGVYSDKKNYSYLEIINVKYPNAIFTMESAFYYHSLTDVIPDKFHLITDKDDTKIRNKKIKQYFSLNQYLEYGVESMEINNTKIKIYSKERLLIELIRYKNKLPFDYYKEIINSYRKIIQDLDIRKIEEYALLLPKSQMVIDALQMEVF